ncbi:MAG: DegV family protein [Anaerolineales bacterium]|nr:DegV family protein [Anaerolineales bacterium]
MSPLRPRVGIVTDSTADIPAHILQSKQIELIPALVMMDGETFIDGVDLSRLEFYRRMPSLTHPPTTASPSPIVFQDSYERLFKQGVEQILSIHVSSHLSGIVNAAFQAAQQFGKRVNVFDSQQLSLGLGYQVIEAANAAAEGLKLEAILDHVRSIREKVRILALIDSLEYLRRSGRVNWLKAGFSELLKIKLLLTVKDGFVESFGQARTFTRALQQLRVEAASWAPLSHLTVMHSGIADVANSLAEDLHSLSSSPPMIVDVTTVIGVHVGPGSIGIAGLPQF